MRIEVCPPALLQRQWRDVAPLGAVRLEFIDALRGGRTPRVGELRARIGRSHSLRELWHLRADVFYQIAHELGESEAHAHVAPLNRHFPTRATRSGFGAFDPSPHVRLEPRP